MRTWALRLAAATLAFALIDARAEPQATRVCKDGLTPAEVEQAMALIRPSPGEDPSLEIAWLVDVEAAQRKAASEGKPLFVFSNGGEPLGGTCHSGLLTRKYFGPQNVEWIQRHCVPVVGNRGNYISMMSANGLALDNARRSPDYIGPSCDPRAALVEFNQLPEADRKPKELQRLTIASRRVAMAPDTLALRVSYRPLERDDRGGLRRSTKFKGGFRGVNRDFVWLKEAEWKSLVPPNPQKGSSIVLPDSLALRLCRFHLSNCCSTAVCGNYVWNPKEIVEREFRLIVEDVTASALVLRLIGSARMQAANGRAEFRVGGAWRYDLRAKAFDRIEFAAIGPFDNALNKKYHARKMMGEDVSLVGIGFELSRPSSLGYGTPPAPFYRDPDGLDYFSR